MPSRSSIRIPPGDLSPRNRSMVAELPWKLIQIKNLPRNYRRALAIQQKPSLHPDDLDAELGASTRIGVVEIPMEVLVIQVMNDPALRRDYDAFLQYHRDYLKDEKELVKSHRQKWPIVLSGESWRTHTIEDGWHRFHSYYRAGKKTVPAMWYADE